MDLCPEFSALIDALTEVLPLTERRVSQCPRDAIHARALEQLRFIETFARTKTVPTGRDASQTDIGIMAVKELEADEPEYARMLMRVNTHFRRLARALP